MTTYQRRRAQVLAALGGRCRRCGLDDPRALQVDHVFGDGAEERRTLRGLAFLNHVLANLSSGRYQLLCGGCNQIKRFTNFEDGRHFSLDAIDGQDLEAFFYDPE